MLIDLNKAPARKDYKDFADIQKELYYKYMMNRIRRSSSRKPPTVTPCPECKGVGKVVCPVCKGMRADLCKRCFGTGRKTR